MIKLEISRSCTEESARGYWYDVEITLPEQHLTGHLIYLVDRHDERYAKKLTANWGYTDRAHKSVDAHALTIAAEQTATEWMASIPWYDEAILDIPEDKLSREVFRQVSKSIFDEWKAKQRHLHVVHGHA